MVEIDFLPLEYHLQHARNQVKPWRIVVVACAVLLVAAAVCAQYLQRRQALGELAAATAISDGASRQNATLAAFQTKLQSARSDAELYTYLRHPWPRSQLLSAVVAPITPEISVLQLQIASEASNEQPIVETRPRAELKAEQEKLRKAPPAVRDATRLRDEFDNQRCYVRIAGVTTDTAALYRYLNAMSKVSYFAKVELKSIESVDTPQGPVMHFQANLRVLPGYGQPGGPKGNQKPENRSPKQIQSPKSEIQTSSKSKYGVRQTV